LICAQQKRNTGRQSQLLLYQVIACYMLRLLWKVIIEQFRAHYFDFGATAPKWIRVSSVTRFLDHIQRLTTVSRTLQRPLSDNTQHSQQTNIHAPGGIRTHNFSRRAAVDLRLRPRSHWDISKHIKKYNLNTIILNNFFIVEYFDM
jgi:hypothetical protein